jgi:hypothetical protein
MVLQMTKKAAPSVTLGFLAACVATLVGMAAARADIFIIESTAAGVAVGSHLASDDAVAIPAGTYIRAVLSSGKTQTIRGPYNGKVADITSGAAQGGGAIEWLVRMFKTGWSTETTTGATRGIARDPGKPRGFSWAEIPTNVDGDLCVVKDSKILVTRVSAARADHATIVDAATGTRAEVVWETGNQTAAWPISLTLRPDGTYQLFLQDRPRRQVVLRVIDKMPDEADTLGELLKRGCKHQFEAWSREQMVARKS